MKKVPFPNTPAKRLRLFFTFFDSRWEDLTKENWVQIVYRDFSAGLIVAMTAIPMAMGFAMAMGMRPENGIIAGALACVIGRTFGGFKVPGLRPYRGIYSRYCSIIFQIRPR